MAVQVIGAFQGNLFKTSECKTMLTVTFAEIEIYIKVLESKHVSLVFALSPITYIHTIMNID